MARLPQCIAGLLVAVASSVAVSAAAQQNSVAALHAKVAELYQAGKYAEAVPLAQRELAILQRALGPFDPNLGAALSNLAALYMALGRYADAEPIDKQVLAIAEKAFGPDHPIMAVALNNLASLYQQEGRYADAEPLFERSLAIREKALGPNHLDVARALNNLGSLYWKEARYAAAEPLYRRSLTIRQAALGPDHPDVAESLNNLASVYQDEGRYGTAEPLYRRSLAIYEKALGSDNPFVAQALNNLALIFQEEGRYPDAESLYKRSLAIREKTLGPDHPDVAQALNNLATLYDSQRRYADAEPLYQRALTIRAKALGPEHPDVGQALHNLASLYQNEGRYAEAEPLYQRSLAIREKALGPDHPDVAESLDGLAGLYHRQARYADAEPLVKRSLAIAERALGPDHPHVVTLLNNLGELYRRQGRYSEALAVVQQLIAKGSAVPAGALPVLFGAVRNNLISADKALDAGLDVVQRTGQTAAAAAVNNLAVRLAAGSDRLAQLVRKDQDLAAEAATLDKAIIAAVSTEPSRRDAAAEQRVKARLAAIAGERAALQKVFASDFPDYAALSNPLPLTAKEVQSLLAQNEALVLFSSASEDESYVFALTREGSDWKPIPLGADAVAAKVAAFRRGLDVDMVEDQSYLDSINEKRELFDLGLANEVYKSLLGPVEPLIKDKRNLIVVPFGPLTALPFHLLVTEPPRVAKPAVDTKLTVDNMAPYREAAWLTKRQAVSVMPSVSSLQVLRQFGRKEQGSKPIIGFGDPVFNAAAAAAAEQQRGAARKVASRSLEPGSYTDFWQGADVDFRQLGRSLPQLPETADELNAVAQKLGASPADIHLGRDASVTTVKRTPLADYRIVYFATHGLVAGDVKGVAEPSLALSIPAQPTAIDDGLLTASEVAQLKLNADWVVLSACNTIAGDRPGAEALSGLARAFFYAGARALLVTHWSVESDSATRLTTATFDNLKADAMLGRADALSRAMLAYIADTSQPRNAYPAVWGPFSIIGEGAAR